MLIRIIFCFNRSNNNLLGLTLIFFQAVATGKYHGAILTNSQEWEDCCMKAGILSGDLLFPIPFAPELHFSEFASAIADMKNSVAVSFTLFVCFDFF